MATTGIWKIEKRLDHVLDYTMNVEKTLNAEYGKLDYQEFHKLQEYESYDYKTEKECYVSGINCLPETAYEDMIFTKKQYRKEKGILGFHAFQSFKGWEVTPDMAHLIGMKLAEEMWGDRFEVVVSTHINTDNIHNHFVINSVSFKDGKKYYDNRENYAKLRHISDSLCQEYGLNVLKEKKCKGSGINYDNYYKGYVAKTNYHTLAKQDLDRAIAMAYSYRDFENIMIKMGYELTNRYGKLSIKRSPYKKNIRIERSFGSAYSISEIEKRIEQETASRVPFIEALNPNKKIMIYEQHKKLKRKGIYGLYKYYCYILKVYPRHYPNKILPASIRLDVQKMNDISNQTRLLVSNKIETYEQFLFYKNNLKNEVNKLLSDKTNLWQNFNRATDEEKRNLIRLEITKVTNELNKKRKEVKLCDGIEKRIEDIKENIQEFENENEKGKVKK